MDEVVEQSAMSNFEDLPKRRLRVCLLVNSFIQPRWVAEVIKDIKASSIAEIALVIKNAKAESSNGRKHGLASKFWENRNYLLYSAYSKLDERVFKVKQNAFEMRSIEDLVADSAVLNVEPVMKKFSDYFTEADIQTILEYKLDVALRFGFRILKGDVLRIAKHGVWSYHHGDASVNRGSPPGFWEVMKGEPLTGSVLQVLTNELDNGKVIYRSWSSTNEKFSVKRNKNNYYWKSSAFVMRKLKELYENNEPALKEDDPRQASFRPYYNRLYKKPTNAEMLPLLTALASRAVTKTLQDAISYDQWFLAYKFKSDPKDINNSLYRFKYLIPPKDRFWADPFPTKVDDKYFIFFEEYTYKSDKAHISVIELNKNGTIQGPLKVLEREYHLSYPFIFEWQGNHYMIPETGAKKTIELYRCHSFPTKWELEKVLMENVRAVDTTLAEMDGLWWMFVNIAADEVSYNYDELHLFYAASPMGPWKPHKRNPVVSDVRHARPAGRLFRWNNELYRPAQDCSKHYGYAISINKITHHSLDEYQEEEVSKILPAWDKSVIGTHTLNSFEDLTVIDCLKKRKLF